MDLSKLSAGPDAPVEVNVVIEVPIGGEPVKYEMDKASGVLFVDRFLYTPMRYPGNYGFIPNTLSEDGDPCDVIIVNRRPVVPGAVVRARPIGVLLMQDEAGPDEKIVAVPGSKLTRRYDETRDVADLTEIARAQIQHFFEHYKDLEPGKWVKILGWGDTRQAHAIIEAARAKFGDDAAARPEDRRRPGAADEIF